jgi:hypothetical protein
MMRRARNLLATAPQYLAVYATPTCVCVCQPLHTRGAQSVLKREFVAYEEVAGLLERFPEADCTSAAMQQSRAALAARLKTLSKRCRCAFSLAVACSGWEPRLVSRCVALALMRRVAVCHRNMEVSQWRERLRGMIGSCTLAEAEGVLAELGNAFDGEV